jgi:hypothetical protein
MRFLITLVVLALFGSPAFAKAKSAVQAPSVFTGKLLTYEQLIALPKEKRMNYLKDMVDLLATMESFNNQYTVAEIERLQDFREQVVRLMQKLSLLPKAQAQQGGSASSVPAGTASGIPIWSVDKWTCGPRMVFDYSIRACLVKNWFGSTRYSRPGKGWLFRVSCPKDTQEVPHYMPESSACIPNANWALISPERREGIKKGGFLSPTFLRSMSPEEQRAEVLGGGITESPTSETQPAALTAPGAPAGDTAAPPRASGYPAIGSSVPPEATDLPAIVKCKSLSSADREIAISRFRGTEKYQGQDANVCIAGGFASSYATARKSPSTCKIVTEFVVKKGTPPVKVSCSSGQALCNPALFCVGGKNANGQFEPVPFCVERSGDRRNRPLTDSCAAKYAQIVDGKAPMMACKPIDPKLSAAKKREAQAQCEANKKVKPEVCDPKYLPPESDFRKTWEELVAQTQKLRDVWCGEEDFAALFCRECEIVSDKIYAMNKEATGSGAPEVRAPTAAPVVDPHPASIDR